MRDRIAYRPAGGADRAAAQVMRAPGGDWRMVVLGAGGLRRGVPSHDGGNEHDGEVLYPGTARGAPYVNGIAPSPAWSRRWRRLGFLAWRSRNWLRRASNAVPCPLRAPRSCRSFSSRTAWS